MMGLGIVIIGPIIAVIWLIFLLLAIFVPRDKKTKLRAVGVVVGLPVVIGIAWMGKVMSASNTYERDFEYFKELCAREAKEKIYRTVEGAEGILQMEFRPREDQTGRAFQYSMRDPYGYVIGDLHDVEASLLTNWGTRRNPRSKGYQFIERMSSGDSSGTTYVRVSVVKTGNKVGAKYPYAENRNEDEFVLKREEFQNKRLSRYGYMIEDRSTRDMRSRWIAGGRIVVFDSETKEILAERIGFFYARYKNGTVPDYPWAGVGPFADHICPANYSLKTFVESVLIPVSN